MRGEEACLEGIKYDQLASEPQSQINTPRRQSLSEEETTWSWHRDADSQGHNFERLPVGPLSPPSSPSALPFRQTPRSNIKQRQALAKHSGRESRARKSRWTCIYSTGVKAVLHSDKRGVIQKFKLGVPLRDMRLLDPNLLTSETGKILVRDNAIVFSMEHVRLIITADCVIVPREGFDHNPLNNRFNQLLEDVVLDFAQTQERNLAEAQALEERLRRDDASDGGASSDHEHEVAPLPFELQVLELAIKDVIQLCSQLTKDLEAVAHPALDALTKSVTTSNLERVRKVKTRHQRLYTRVQTMREELQRFLEDDDDMIKMCLTRKKELETAAGGRHAGPGLEGFLSVGGRRHSMNIPAATPRNVTPFLGQGSPPFNTLDRSDSGALVQAQQEEESESQEAVENLLESYFMQVDGTHDRLDAIGEFIEDTEEYINIELDSSRNRLLRLEIVLTAGTFGITMFSLVAGILGENLVIPELITKDISGFLLVNLATLAVCLLFFTGLMAYIRYRRLM